jgi:cytochrome c oxidase assembly factor CtaG
MDDVTRAILRSWDLRPEVIVPLVLLSGLYTFGWLRLRRARNRSGKPVRLASLWRLGAYWLGIFFLVLALLSPIETLSNQLFSMHMVQHLLLAMFAPPLLWVADPMPVSMWGLPPGLRHGIGRFLFHKRAPARPLLTLLTRPAVAWLSFFIFLWGWHDPDLYNLALRVEWVHDLEHLTFFVPAMLLWWHLTGAGPRLHRRRSYPARVALTLAAIPANMFLGIAIALADSVIYTYYETVPFRPWGISVLDDQRIGGAIMWVPGSMMYVLTVVILVGLYLHREERKPPLDIARMHREGKFDLPAAQQQGGGA